RLLARRAAADVTLPPRRKSRNVDGDARTVLAFHRRHLDFSLSAVLFGGWPLMKLQPSSARFSVAVAAALLTLLTLTAALSRLHLGPWGLPVALTIAALKAALVILFFMEARASGQIIWMIASIGLVWLLLLLGGTSADYTSRRPASSPLSSAGPT